MRFLIVGRTVLCLGGLRTTQYLLKVNVIDKSRQVAMVAAVWLS